MKPIYPVIEKQPDESIIVVNVDNGSAHVNRLTIEAKVYRVPQGTHEGEVACTAHASGYGGDQIKELTLNPFALEEIAIALLELSRAIKAETKRLEK
jgi:hypothetical protein